MTELTDDEREIYGWQMDVPGLGEAGQRKLKDATVLVSRCGGLGGLVAYELAAAGVGRLIIPHGGVLKRSDLHRQLLQTHDHVGKLRINSIVRRLRELNPRCEVVGLNEHVTEANAERLVAQADVVVDAAPLFAERFAMNRAAVRLGRPMVECAMYALELTVATILPGRTACLRCWCREAPPTWTRRFPVLGAVSGTAGCIGAVEVVKLITGLGEPLAGRMLCADLGSMRFRTVRLARDPACPDCGEKTS
jgi:molybdopterin/thiamine biosynthesis adenylyltransferase